MGSESKFQEEYFFTHLIEEVMGKTEELMFYAWSMFVLVMFWQSNPITVFDKRD